MEFIICTLIVAVAAILVSFIVTRKQKSVSANLDDFDEIVESAKDEIKKDIQDLEEQIDANKGEFKSETVSVDNQPLMDYIDKKFLELRTSMCEVGVGSLVKALKNKPNEAPAPEAKTVTKEVTKEVKVKELPLSVAEVERDGDETTVTFSDGEEVTVKKAECDVENAELAILYAIAKRCLTKPDKDGHYEDLSYCKTLEELAKTAGGVSPTPKTQEPKKEPGKPAEAHENGAAAGSRDQGNQEVPKSNKAAEKGYKGFLIYTSHKTVNQTDFMGNDGEYATYPELSESDKIYNDVAQIKKEVEEMRADQETFKDFNVGVVAITEDGPKMLKDEEVAELL